MAPAPSSWSRPAPASQGSVTFSLVAGDRLGLDREDGASRSMTRRVKRRCVAISGAGQRCQAYAMRGTDRCKQHSGDPNVGRRSRLTPTVRNPIVRTLASGCYRQTAAEVAGVGKSTLYRWLEQGEHDFEDGRTTPYRELWEATKKAEADAEVEAIELIREAATRSWQAAAWLLERKYPDRWGRRARLDHRHDAQPRREVVEIPNDEERLREVASILRETGALPRLDESPRWSESTRGTSRPLRKGGLDGIDGTTDNDRNDGGHMTARKTMPSPQTTFELFGRLIEDVQQEHDLSDSEAMCFVQESCSAGGLPNAEEEPEVVEELRAAAIESRSGLSVGCLRGEPDDSAATE
jgi:transposase